jgi:hypothetical protein
MTWELKPIENDFRREYTRDGWRASCLSDGCVEIDDPHDGDLHICNLEEHIASLIQLHELATRDFVGTPGEEKWVTTEGLARRARQYDAFKATLRVRYPDTYARVFGGTP